MTGLAAALAFVWARRRGLTGRPSGPPWWGWRSWRAGSSSGSGQRIASRLDPSRYVPLLWIGLAGRRAEAGSLGTLVLAMVAALQTLHAYPIAGTQVAWATFLAIPVGGVALADGWRRIRDALAEAEVFDAARRRLAGVALGVALVTVTVSGAYATHGGSRRRTLGRSRSGCLAPSGSAYLPSRLPSTVSSWGT